MNFQKRIERKLICELSDSELQTRSASLADTVTTIDQVKAARTQAMKEFKDVIAGHEERQRELSRAIRTGQEERLVACVVNYHSPVEATKQIVRLDTGEIVCDEPMSPEECQTKIWQAPEATEPLPFEKGDESDGNASSEV